MVPVSKHFCSSFCVVLLLLILTGLYISDIQSIWDKKVDFYESGSFFVYTHEFILMINNRSYEIKLGCGRWYA